MMKIAVAVLATVVVGGSSAATASAPSPVFGYPLAIGTYASALTAGPDGNVWFTASKTSGSGSVVGKIAGDGAVTEYRARLGRGARSIVDGPDGNLWFVQWRPGAIVRSATDGTVTSFPLPDRESGPTAIAAGSDGNLWFTERRASKIGRIAPRGQIVEFPLIGRRQPVDIVAGSDGALWFTERRTNSIGRITIDGQISRFRVPGRWGKLGQIALGPDGNLWFTEKAVPRIGRITPNGEVTHFPVPTEHGTEAIVSGPGERLWFTAGDEVGAIDTLGGASWPACLTDRCQVSPRVLAVGSDGKLWVGAGPESCNICGGGSAIALVNLKPGGVGSYELPTPPLAIGPRATPVRDGETTLAVACGLPIGCRGVLRLGGVNPRNGMFGTSAEGPYDLVQGEVRRISVRFSGAAVRSLSAHPTYYEARASSGGTVEAKRGGIRLKLAGGPRRGSR